MSRAFDGLRRTPKPQSPTPLTVTPIQGYQAYARHTLGVAIFALTATLVYLLAAPYIPSLYYHFQPPPAIAMPTVATYNALAKKDTAASVPYFGANTLTIGKIGVQSDIKEGVDENTLDQGLWRRPNTSTPELGGNTVIAGHRFKYTTGPNTFYNLDKVDIGDPIALTWKGKLYTYTVYQVLTVGVHDTWVEDNTADPELTLYTCTPLWTSTNRLVVRAHLDQAS